MALRTSIVSGNFTAAGTWGLVDATSYLGAETGSEVLTTAGSGTRSSAFTPGAIEVSHIGVKLSVRTGTTGTISVRLVESTVEVAGTLVTINTADLPVAATADANGGWVFFKLATPITLSTGAHNIEAFTSSSSQVSLFRDGTVDNISRALITTTTGAPATGDDLIVAGEYTGAGTSNSFTVTQDNTATTDFGAAPTAAVSLLTPGVAVCSKGTVTWGASASTAYYLKMSNSVVIYSGGAWNQGTVATPIPSTSTAELQFDPGANVDYGLVIRNLGNFIAQGAAKTSKTLLNTDEAVASTVWGVGDTTGWAAGDIVNISGSSTNVSNFHEERTISTVDSATQITVTSGLTNAHAGTAPTQADVINVTRNVKVRGTSDTLQAYVSCAATATVDCDYVEFQFLGSATAGKRGIDILTTTGSSNFNHCALHDFVVSNSIGFFMSGSASNNYTITNSVGYRILGAGSSAGFFSNTVTTGTNWTVDSCCAFNCASTDQGVFNLLDVGGTCTNNIAGSGLGSNPLGFNLSEAAGVIGTFSGNISHSSRSGFHIFVNGGTISNCTAWRHVIHGFRFSSATSNLTLLNCTAFANATADIGSLTTIAISNVIIDTFTSNAGTSTASPLGVEFTGMWANVRFQTCSFGVTTTHATGDVGILTSCIGLKDVSLYLNPDNRVFHKSVRSSYSLFSVRVR